MLTDDIKIQLVGSIRHEGILSLFLDECVEELCRSSRDVSELTDDDG